MLSRRSALMAAVLLVFGATATGAQPMIPMTGKVALVTGSTSGLGETVARRLGAMGATVIIHGLNPERGEAIAAEITRAGPGKAEYFAADLASLRQVEALAQRVLSTHPRLHLLINNAGIGGVGSGE